MNWKKIIADSDKKKIEDKLGSIYNSLDSIENEMDSISLLDGKASLAIFYYYWKQMKNKKYLNKGFEFLTKTLDRINSGFSYDTFSAGLAGIAWSFNHLYKNSLIEENPDELFGELDQFFVNHMMTYMKMGKYDYLHGGLGIALYLLERNTQEVKKSLKEFIKVLEEKGKNESDCIKWLSVLDKDKGSEGYNLSLSHGIASIIVILAYLYRKGIEKDRTLRLINRAVNYLLKQKKSLDNFSLFPSWISKDSPANESRLAWCYGDLGIGITLFQAAVIIGDENLKKESLVILKHTTKRRDLEQNRVIDAGLCHGAAGIAHIYNRMFNYTGDEEFKDSALYWIEQTLKMAVFDDGLAGYKAWKTKNYGGWVNEAGLLEGIAGIGLMLISAVSNIEPSWDRCLLLS